MSAPAGLVIPGVESPGSSVFDVPLHFGESTSRNNVNSVDSSGLISPTGAQMSTPVSQRASFVVVSGGTGCNAICAAFEPHEGTVNGGRNGSYDGACYILPVSDDGGSSSEIIRVLGGPSIGDIRSRLIRLIPHATPGSPEAAIQALLAHRFPSSCTQRQARAQWHDIVCGRSALWKGIPSDRKETIRGFLVYFENELLRRAHKNFSFVNGSVGNYFLAAAQMFFRSLPSAIFLFSSITKSQANILPVVVTNHTVTIAAELENGESIFGQCEISHPVRPTPYIAIDSTFVSYAPSTASSAANSVHNSDSDSDTGPDAGGDTDDEEERLSRRQPRARNMRFDARSKGPGAVADVYDTLPARISRIYYINAYGQEVHPAPNREYVDALGERDVLVYSCGSLWTSIIPCLALRGVAHAIARSRSLRAKILLLNAKNDRETDGYAAVDYISAIVHTLNASYGSNAPGGGFPCSAFVTHVVYLAGTEVSVDEAAITALGVRCVRVESTGPGARTTADGGTPQFDAACVRRAMRDILADAYAD